MASTKPCIDVRKLRYSGQALRAMKCVPAVNKSPAPHDLRPSTQQEQRLDRQVGGCHNGTFPLTSEVAPWVKDAFCDFECDQATEDFVRPFSAEFRSIMEAEREQSSGLHDLDTIEFIFQHTLKISAAIALAADASGEPVDANVHLHTSRAGNDDHFASWGLLLTGLRCDPPIVVQFPFYLFLCQAFTFEPAADQVDYVHSTLMGIDWVRGHNTFSDRRAAFEEKARTEFRALDTITSGKDRCSVRIPINFLKILNDSENSRSLKAPPKSHIDHGLKPNAVIAMRAVDTIGSAYMSCVGAGWFDDEGFDSLIGSGLANDVMDLHTDILTGETRNLLRLLYPSDVDIAEALRTSANLLTSMLCEIFRGHRRARMHHREDGRISSASPPYSFCRARHRHIFETLELYSRHYPQFWEWTWEIYYTSKSQLTDASLKEPLVQALQRVATPNSSSGSSTAFFHLWHDMIEQGSEQMSKSNPLGVPDELASHVRELYTLWHCGRFEKPEQPGWGRRTDERSDELLGEVGEILARQGCVSDAAYKFGVAYGRLSMGWAYIAYHTIAAIIMSFGAIRV